MTALQTIQIAYTSPKRIWTQRKKILKAQLAEFAKYHFMIFKINSDYDIIPRVYSPIIPKFL